MPTPHINVRADWPGQPTTVGGLAAALRPIVGQTTALIRYYRELIPPPTPPRRTTVRKASSVALKMPVPVQTAQRRPAQGAAELSAALAAAAASIPQVLAACEVLSSPLPEGRVLAVDARPVLIPDDAAHRVVDAGTGDAVAPQYGLYSHAGDTVTWWPLPPLGMTLTTAPPGAVVTSNAWRHRDDPLSRDASWPPPDLPAIVGCAESFALLRRQQVDYRATAEALRRHPGANKPHRAAYATSTAYRRWVRLLEAQADRLATQYVQHVHALRQALDAMAAFEGNQTMPAATLTTPAVISDIAQRIREQITSSGGGRLQVSDSEIAFSWTNGLPATMLNYLAAGVADGRHIDTVTASDSGAANGSIPEGGTKPDGVVFETASIDLAKFADTATISTESAQFVSSIEQAVTSVLVGRILRGIEADTVSTMVANAGVTITAATDMTTGVLQAVAELAQNGSTATVVGLSAADWVSVFSATGGNGYINFASPESGPRGLWLGLVPCLVPTLTAGNAIVADGAAAAVFEIPGGPLVVVDPYSALKTNKITIAIETWAKGNVNSPGGVATVAVTAGGATASASRKEK